MDFVAHSHKMLSLRRNYICGTNFYDGSTSGRFYTVNQITILQLQAELDFSKYGIEFQNFLESIVDLFLVLKIDTVDFLAIVTPINIDIIPISIINLEYMTNPIKAISVNTRIIALIFLKQSINYSLLRWLINPCRFNRGASANIIVASTSTSLVIVLNFIFQIGSIKHPFT